MKRRNVESTKNRKQFHFKRCKFAEGMVGSNTFLYLKFLLIWALIMTADYLIEFRFEFLWPFWLVIRSLHDSFKYQGVIFSIFFALIAFLSDLLFYMFLPVQWLFFAASTYVWVQYVWHTEKGICLPTISLWLLFVYIEASLRLKTLKTVDLCRPFAAHCIGYPMVTLGFGLKSYLSYKLRLKKQKEIQKLNEFHMQLIAKALPLELQLKDKEKFKNINYEEQISTQVVSNSSSSSSSILGTLCSLATSSKNNVTNEPQIPNFRHSLNKENKNTSNKTNSQSNYNNLNGNNGNNSASGIIASALSFCLNSNNVNNNNNSNVEEEAPYIQQKDNITEKQNFNKAAHNIYNNNSTETNLEQNNPKTYFENNKNKKSNFSSNNFNDTTSSSGKNNSENSVNCNVSSFSISSLAYSNENSNVKQANASTQASNNTSNLVLLSNSNTKMGDNHNDESHNENGHHHRSSSASSNNNIPNNSNFLPNNSNNHTNININMTINATAIAAATAQATANAPKVTNGNTKGRKNKESTNNKDTQQRANSVASTTSSSSSNSVNGQNGQKNKSKNSNENDLFNFKDDLISRLEDDLKKLREENEQQKTVEQYLRNQINYVTKCDRTEKLKSEKLQQENKTLQTKINKMISQSQKEKDELNLTEKHLQDEKRYRLKVETQFAHEKKQRESHELQIHELKKTNDTMNLVKSKKQGQEQTGECSLEKCSKKLKEIENENKKLVEDMRKKQDRVVVLECEIKSLNRSRDTENRVDTLMVALNLMEDKNSSLQESLSAETRFKLDLFSALGEARRQLESVNFQFKSKERELNAFKTLFKQTLSASANPNLNNVLNNYLNGSSVSGEDVTNTTSNIMVNNNILNSNNVSSSQDSSNSNSKLNEWNSSSEYLPFLPKI